MGKYTVKSGYRLAMRNEKNNTCSGECSKFDSKNNFWLALWRIGVPNKIKLFIWRASLNILPCAANLCRRSISNISSCFRCGYNEESIFHAIWSCPYSKKIWKLTKWRHLGKIYNNVPDLFAAVFNLSNSEDVETVAYLCWLCWGERNNTWHGKTMLKEPGFLISHAQCLLEEYKKANAVEVTQKVDRNIKWFPPPEGYYKLNTDAAVHNTQGRRGLGAVIRNSKGGLMGAYAYPMRGFFSPLVSELLALKAGIRFAIDSCISPTMVEVDCMEAARLVNSPEIYWGEEGHLVEDIKTLLPAIGTNQVVYRPREGNIVAHAIAKFIVDESLEFSCLESGPSWLMESIIYDSSAL